MTRDEYEKAFRGVLEAYEAAIEPLEVGALKAYQAHDTLFRRQPNNPSLADQIQYHEVIVCILRKLDEAERPFREVVALALWGLGGWNEG